jgi:uncharacterized protein YidB (DUF937 family)
MGLLDGLVGQVLGGLAQDGMNRGGLGRGDGIGSAGGGLGGAGMAAIIAIALQMLQRNGGIENVLGRLREQGHGREADSWVGSGQNERISPDVLADLFGRDEVTNAARQMGVEPQDALGGLADVFPEVVNQMTPQGRVESSGDDLVARALEDLQRNARR